MQQAGRGPSSCLVHCITEAVAAGQACAKHSIESAAEHLIVHKTCVCYTAAHQKSTTSFKQVSGAGIHAPYMCNSAYSAFKKLLRHEKWSTVLCKQYITLPDDPLHGALHPLANRNAFMGDGNQTPRLHFLSIFQASKHFQNPVLLHKQFF